MLMSLGRRCCQGDGAVSTAAFSVEVEAEVEAELSVCPGGTGGLFTRESGKTPPAAMWTSLQASSPVMGSLYRRRR
jgi:hypothetical protein